MEKISKKSSGILYWIMGIVGICFVILVHEFGHFTAAQFFNVDTPVFSVGFGPVLASTHIGNTTFEFAAFPVGGYVSINQTELAALPYIKKVIIMIAGILFNFIFGALVIFYLAKLRSPKSEDSENPAPNRLIQVARTTGQFFKDQSKNRSIIGPIGIISTTGKSLALGFDYFLFSLALLSINIGAFNLLPIPFFDGGQIAKITVETITGPLSGNMVSLVNMLFFSLFIAFMMYISLRDVRNLEK